MHILPIDMIYRGKRYLPAGRSSRILGHSNVRNIMIDTQAVKSVPIKEVKNSL
jgi:hypothetical protein